MRLLSAGYRGLDVLLRAVVRNGGEILGQLALRNELPGTVERGCGEPTARGQHVGPLALEVLEDVAGGVVRVEELRALDRHVAGLAVEHQELRGAGGDHDRRHRTLCERRRIHWRRRVLRSLWRFLGVALEQIRALLCERSLLGFVDLLRGLRRDRVRPVEVPGGHPAVEEVEIVIAALRAQDQRTRIEHALVVGVRDLPVLGLSVDEQQHRRCVGEHQARHRVLYRHAIRLLLRFDHRELRLDPIQRHRPHLVAQASLEDAPVPGSSLGRRRKLHFVELEPVEEHDARVLVDASPRAERDDPVHEPLRRLAFFPRLRHGDSRPGLEGVAVPRIELRLEHRGTCRPRDDCTAGPDRAAAAAAPRERPGLRLDGLRHLGRRVGGRRATFGASPWGASRPRTSTAASVSRWHGDACGAPATAADPPTRLPRRSAAAATAGRRQQDEGAEGAILSGAWVSIGVLAVSSVATCATATCVGPYPHPSLPIFWALGADRPRRNAS